MDKKLKIISIIVGVLIAIVISGALIFSPENTRQKEEQGLITDDVDISVDSKPQYKVFFENTGSMNGYVRGNTRVKDVLHDLLANIQTHSLSDNEINLNFVNSVVIPTQTGISGFRDALDPAVFSELCSQYPGCSLGDTYFPDIYKTTLNSISENDVGIWISDCIPSTGDEVSTREVLNRQSIEIRRIFSEKLMEYNFNTLVLHLSSNYNGQYWDKYENTTYINNVDRPYYIWVFGKTAYLEELKEVIEQTGLLQQGLLNYHHFFFYDSGPLEYSIRPNPKIGNFSLVPGNPYKIDNARAETSGHLSGVFQFPVYIDFSELPLDESYYTNPANYELCSHYTMEIESTDRDGYTHLMRLRTENLQSETLEIRLKNQLPKWVYYQHLYDDSDILSEEQIDKTFGFKYLLRGVHDAYMARQGYEEYYFNLKLYIN